MTNYVNYTNSNPKPYAPPRVTPASLCVELHYTYVEYGACIPSQYLFYARFRASSFQCWHLAELHRVILRKTLCFSLFEMCFFNHPQNVYYGSRFFGRAPT